jgi:hypothetical protein
MLCGARSLYAIAQWGCMQPEAVRRVLGFTGPHMPGVTTLRYVFKRLDVERFEQELQAWAAQTLDAHTQQAVLDGKALRRIYGEELPGVRLVALHAPEAGLVLAPAGVRTKEEQAKTEEERAQAKQEAELSVAPRLLAQLPNCGDQEEIPSPSHHHGSVGPRIPASFSLTSLMSKSSTERG